MTYEAEVRVGSRRNKDSVLDRCFSRQDAKPVGLTVCASSQLLAIIHRQIKQQFEN